MIDVQSQRDERNIPIDKVGVKGLKYPISVLDRAAEIQHTVGEINMSVNLPHHSRGTHMSRFVEVLNEHHRELDIDKVGLILQKLKAHLGAEEANMEVSFPYFIQKQAPVSGAKGMMEYCCYYIATLKEKEDIVLGVDVPVTTLCPCSKELSEQSAHNQRSVVRIRVRYSDHIWLEELIKIAEDSASSPVYSLLKRSDEKELTELAYNQPKFVEDVVREVSEKLNSDERVQWYFVESENFESIHNHSAYASITKPTR
ncbi:MAG: GTP cyclohydrolase FolE2 [Candidatus Rifleibacteriota bacterium]